MSVAFILYDTVNKYTKNIANRSKMQNFTIFLLKKCHKIEHIEKVQYQNRKINFCSLKQQHVFNFFLFPFEI